MPTHVTITESVFVRAEPDVVWDFTQDFLRRARWDASVLEAEVLSETPQRRVRIRGVGGLRCVLEYKQFERPTRTSLAMVEVTGSRLIVGGGGSWSYERSGGATRWTQTNTLALGLGPLGRLMSPLVRRQLRRTTCKAMLKAAHEVDGLDEHSTKRWTGKVNTHPLLGTELGLIAGAIALALVYRAEHGSAAVFLAIPALLIVDDTASFGFGVLCIAQWTALGALVDLWRWRRRRSASKANAVVAKDVDAS
jgi:hypothetical protein